MSVRRGIDVGRLSSAVERPGIDPRVWLVLAVVRDVGYDADTGMYADIQMMPSGDIETCLIGAEYAGDGFGAYFPPKVGDVVLVGLPGGDPGNGPILIKRIWTGSEKPPSQLHLDGSSNPTDATEDPTIVVEPGRKLRIIANDGATISLECSGTGSINLAATGAAQVKVTAEQTIIVDSPDVRIGTTAGQAVARVGDLVAGPALGVIIPPATVPLPVIPIPGPAVPPYVMTVGQIVSGASSVKA